MAKQVGPIKITGTVAGITFYKMGDEFYARAKGGPAREKVLKDKAFVRTRENADEFAGFSQAAKTLARGIRLLNTSDSKLYRKVFALLLQLKAFDKESKRGKRNLLSALKHPEARKQLAAFTSAYGVDCLFREEGILLRNAEKKLEVSVDINKAQTLVRLIPEKTRRLRKQRFVFKDTFVALRLLRIQPERKGYAYGLEAPG